MKLRILFLALALAACDRSVAEVPIDVPAVEQVSRPVPVSSQTSSDIVGRVVGVHDGDTITVYRPGEPEAKIRFAEIDAPELGQPFGQNSKQMLSDLLFGVPVRVVVEDVDRYGRHVGRVYADDQDINAEMVRRGGAWVYPDYSRDPTFPPMEVEARRSEIGLWAPDFAQGRVEPWNWRRGRRVVANDNAPVAPPQAPPERSLVADGSCTKTRCSEMTTCAEAHHHLEVCRVQSLDGDRDGTPCESIC